jgi:hypothetical protein
MILVRESKFVSQTLDVFSSPNQSYFVLYVTLIKLAGGIFEAVSGIKLILPGARPLPPAPGHLRLICS